MTYRIEFDYRCTDFRKFEQGTLHQDVKADSAQEALNTLLNMPLPNRGVLKDHYEIWNVNIFQLVERPTNGWVEKDNPHLI